MSKTVEAFENLFRQMVEFMENTPLEQLSEFEDHQDSPAMIELHNRFNKREKEVWEYRRVQKCKEAQLGKRT